MTLGQLAEKLKDHQFSLFLGAGSSMDAGGPSGKQLERNIKARYNIKDPNGTLAFFELMDKILGENDTMRREVEEFIRNTLKHISVTQNHKYLFSLPWRAVLTTNYDDVPEMIGKTLRGDRTIMVISHPRDEIDLEKKEVLYCMKVFGDMKIPFDQPGCMILTNEDRRVAYFQQQIYKAFAELSSAGYVVYVGYSFEDSFVFDILREMSRTTHKSLWPGFAISPAKPRLEILEKMRKYGIEWIAGTLEEFIGECQRIHGESPKSTPEEKTPLMIHNRLITLSREVDANINGKYYYLNQSLMNYQTRPIDFVSGSDRKFEPYRRRWDYSRRFKVLQIKDKSEESLDSHDFVKTHVHLDFTKNGIFLLLGGPASGKTIGARRIAYDWYLTGNPVIFFANNYKIDRRALQDLMEEMRTKYHSTFSEDSEHILPMRYLVVVENARPYLKEIIELHKYLTSLAKPVDLLIVERRSVVRSSDFDELGLNAVLEIDDSIQEEELEKFIKHFQDLRLLHDRQAIIANLKDPEINSSFFALLYTSVHEIQKSLRESIIKEFQGLSDKGKAVYGTVAILRAYAQKAYIPLVSRAAEIDDISIIQLLEGELRGVLDYEKYTGTLTVNHRIVAEIVAGMQYQNEDALKEILTKIIRAINSKEINQIEMLHDILPRRLIEEQRFRPLSFEVKEELFKVALSVIESGILLHHLARLYLKNGKLTECEHYLKQSYDPRDPRKPESPFYIRDTEARLALERARIARSKQDKSSSYGYLQNAEALFLSNRTEFDIPHPYSYQGTGEAYFRMAELTESYPDKSNLLALAVSACGTYKNMTGDVTNEHINDLQNNIFAEMEKIGFDEKLARNIAAEKANAEGFAYLAERRIDQSDYIGASRLVNEGLTFDKSSSWLNGLRILCIRKLWPGDGKTLGEALLSWEKVAKGPFNIGLTFELAKFYYMNEKEIKALQLFKELAYRSYSHPSRLVTESDDRWMEGEEPRIFEGTIKIPPMTDRLGEISCTSESTLRKNILVPRRAIKFDKPEKFQRVTFQIAFNYLGPIASEVRSAL